MGLNEKSGENDCIDDLRATLTHARLCHEAWWFFESAHPQRDQVCRSFNYYVDFFGTVCPALFVTFITKLSTVFDEDKNSISLHSIPNIDSESTFHDTWRRGRILFRYRNKLIAHRHIKIAERDFAKETGFDLHDLKRLLDAACQLFDNFALKEHIALVHPFSNSGDLSRLMADIDPLRRA